MKFIQYKIQKGDTIVSIAEKFDLKVDDLKNFHNSKCGVASLIITDKLPIHLKYVIISDQTYKKSMLKSHTVEELKFNNIARYRCEQLNVRKINNETITLSASTYTEFLVEKADHIDIFNVDMTDFNFSVDPVAYEKGFQLAQKLDKLKVPIKFNIAETGCMDKIYNQEEIGKKWVKFRDFNLINDEVYKELISQAPKQADDIISTGNKEFLDNGNLSKMMDKNLFFHVFGKAYQGESLKDYELNQFSQLFPNINLKTDVVKSLISEDENFSTYRLVGTLNKSNLSEDSLKEMYDKIYKPLIKFGYTEFNFIYRIRYTVNKKNNMLKEGKVSIAEKIKNNFEVITEYIIKNVEL